MTVRSVCVLSSCVLPLLLVAAPSLRAAGQRPVPPPLVFDGSPLLLTKIEALLATPNALLIRDLYRIDSRLNFGVALDAAVVTEVGFEAGRLRGLRIELRDAARPLERLSASWLDLDEAVGLSRALGAMSDLARKWSAHEEQRSSDLHFATVGGFAVDLHQSYRVQSATLSSGFADVVRRSIEIGDFSSFKVVVDQALLVLANK